VRTISRVYKVAALSNMMPCGLPVNFSLQTLRKKFKPNRRHYKERKECVRYVKMFEYLRSDDYIDFIGEICNLD